MNVAADEAEMFVAHQRAGQQADFGEHLKSVADAEYESARSRVTLDRLHDRRELRESAGAKVIAVCETAGDDHAVSAFEISVLVPEDLRVGAEECLRHVQRIVIAIRTRQQNNSE